MLTHVGFASKGRKKIALYQALGETWADGSDAVLSIGTRFRSSAGNTWRIIAINFERQTIRVILDGPDTFGRTDDTEHVWHCTSVLADGIPLVHTENLHS